jgi:hypothetical protein
MGFRVISFAAIWASNELVTQHTIKKMESRGDLRYVAKVVG